jgi:hypothetical protein
MPRVEFVCPVHGIRHGYDTRILSPDLHETIQKHETSIYCKKCGKKLIRNESGQEVSKWSASIPST